LSEEPPSAIQYRKEAQHDPLIEMLVERNPPEHAGEDTFAG
jgi:hypothetical protein